MESFFALLKRERVTRQRYLTRKQARTDILITLSGFITVNGITISLEDSAH